MLSRLCYKQAAVLSQTLKCSSKKISTLRTPLDIFTNKLQFKILNRSLATKSVDAKLKNDIQVQVYYGALTPQIRMVKIFSLATSVTGLMFQPILLQKTDVIGGLPALIAMAGFVGFFTFVTPFLLHFVCKKYVTTMNYNPISEEYTAVTYSFFMRKKILTFRPQDAKVPDVPGMFTSIIVKDTPLFLDPKMFSNPDHYIKIMGYDKPMDFKLGIQDEDSEQKNK